MSNSRKQNSADKIKLIVGGLIGGFVLFMTVIRIIGNLWNLVVEK